MRNWLVAIMSMIDEQRRKYFRVKFYESIKAVAEVLQIKGKNVSLGKLFQVNLLDLSAGGTKINTYLELPVTSKPIIRISFVFEEETYELCGEIVRTAEGSKNEYGIKFIGLSEKEVQRLIISLNEHQVKKKKISRNGKLSKRLEPLVKILQLLPFAAYLVTREHAIVAANKAAKEIGVAIEEKCYLTIYKRRTVCQHCQLNQAASEDKPLSCEVVIRDQKYLAHWLHLEDGLTLHYFIIINK
jgi:hypothetical protein